MFLNPGVVAGFPEVREGGLELFNVLLREWPA